MTTPPPVSVLLPTVEWTDACREVRDQLGADDQLLIVCDSPEDPVFGHHDDLPEMARILVAGDPEGCSGKANALVVGMAAAKHDRIVWTDDDFYHPPDWLEQLRADYERHGPTTELPVLVGRDPLACLLEPCYAQITLLLSALDAPWGGALIFDRSDVDGEALCRDLQRTVSDDGTLREHVDFTATDRTRRVAAGGTLRETLERHVRFVQIFWRHGTRVWLSASALLAVILAVPLVLSPVLGVVATTLWYAAIYATLGLRRWTLVLAYPAFLLWTPLLVYALARRTFVWGGRRYRWRSMFDVEIVE